MNNKYNKIIFYNNCYDGEELIWQAGKEYKIIGESTDLYICECEPYLKNDKNTPDKKSEVSTNYGIEKSILNMYYLI